MLKLIAGLGNPGRKFQNTRHNFGGLVLEAWAKKHRLDFSMVPKFEAQIAEQKTKSKTQSDKLILAKLQTMMNRSGQTIKKICQASKIKPEEILIVHDDFDIPFGQMKLCFGSGSAGHRGVQSIIEELSSKDFFRLRLGIKPEINFVPTQKETKNQGGTKKELSTSEKGGGMAGEGLERFVLEKFSCQEKNQLPLIIKKATHIISAAVGTVN